MDKREKNGVSVYVVVEEVEKILTDLNEKNKYKLYKADSSLKNFNYRQHKQERANYECYKLIKSNTEVLMKWKYSFIVENKVCRDDLVKAYVEIFNEYLKNIAFAYEKGRILSKEYQIGLINTSKSVTGWLDTIKNKIERLEEEK